MKEGVVVIVLNDHFKHNGDHGTQTQRYLGFNAALQNLKCFLFVDCFAHASGRQAVIYSVKIKIKLE